MQRKRKRDENTSAKVPKTENSALSCLDQPPGESVHEAVTFAPHKLPAAHYDPETTKPISCSLESLEELLSWKLIEASPFNVASVPLASRDPPLNKSPKRTLVSHDMMGGYLDDRFIQGAEVEAPYAFYHWEYIDIFNYFSHHMVTIPPAAWTNAAHKHGVLSIGTFITEWTSGEKICEMFLADEESYRAAADKLVQICHYYEFDGWLINIENVLSETAVKNASLFLRYLTDQIHERIPGSLVIWYDSVLKNGSLIWQNELNDNNKVFFDACDGIFTNYNWTEQSLVSMKAHSAAQGRFADIYALELIRKYELSTAIFAPGWVYECHEKVDFRKNQDKFWSLLVDFLYLHRYSTSLPFISSFCQGFGKSIYWRGKVEQQRNWFNLNAQELQALHISETMKNGGWLRSRGCSEDAWSGGSSLMLEGMIPSGLPHVCARLFSLHVPLADRTFVSFVYKPPEGVKVSLELKTIDASLCTYGGIEEIESTSLLDADSLHAPLVSVKGICISDVFWQKGTLKENVQKVLLSATLRWKYPSKQVRHYRIHWRHLRGPDPRVPSGALALVGRSYSSLYRLVELEVPAPPGLIELLVEPVTRESFRTPEAQWGRCSLSYNQDTSPSATS
ncbi:hypothetical protein DNTS_003878 [Danionella cerebrum]|uniref:Cytosolic endo-beta-N-acetylglucosaminidase n=1 Tax=Danionella cerebrum TaxID=2873325 RepID=A0A553N2C4_9TELE|nr:hypothetical protein DNTS_003878 [Danionella translucida]